jgi:hypothetical protein
LHDLCDELVGVLDGPPRIVDEMRLDLLPVHDERLLVGVGQQRPGILSGHPLAYPDRGGHARGPRRYRSGIS